MWASYVAVPRHTLNQYLRVFQVALVGGGGVWGNWRRNYFLPVDPFVTLTTSLFSTILKID